MGRTNPTRRSVLRGSLAVASAGAVARPYIANAAATTATVWWVQGFAQEEDVSFKKLVADYERASGNSIDYSIIPYAPERQKIISAMTSGVVPDLFQNNPFEIVALLAWDDKLIDVSDVVSTQKEEYTEAALLSAYCYNRVEKRRSFYGVPYTASVSANANLIAGDGMKNGFPAPNKDCQQTKDDYLTRKAPYRFESAFLRVCELSVPQCGAAKPEKFPRRQAFFLRDLRNGGAV